MTPEPHRRARGRRPILSAALLAALCLPAPARAGAEGVYGPLEVKDSERKLMENTAATEDLFVRRGYRYAAPELEAAVSRVGSRVAPPPTDSYQRYRFHVVRDADPNAFALPDGQVYVNTGLLVLLENEAQLAAVLAHEVHHTAGHHGLLAYRSARRKIITSMVLGPLTLGVSDYFLALSIVGYSRDLEEEADRKGVQRMLQAGYDPRQAPRVYEILLRDPEGESFHVATKWSDHPELQVRIAYTREMLPALLARANPASLEVGAESYRRLVRRASIDTVEDLIAADYARSAVDLAQRLVRENGGDPAAQLALGDSRRALGARPLIAGGEDLSQRERYKNAVARARYTRDERQEKLLTTDEGRQNLRKNLAAAQLSYRKALALDPRLAEAHRGLGYALKELDRPVDAGREFVAYLEACPQATDRPLILEDMKEINEAIRKGGKGP